MRMTHGFTLVEVLAAVAVIGILAALLLPALEKALLEGRMTHTVSNMRQIGTAVNEYVADNDGRLPGPWTVSVYVFARKYALTNDVPHLGNYIGQYIGAPDIPPTVRPTTIVPGLQCPLLGGAAQQSLSIANYATWDYPYNNPNNRFGGGGTVSLIYMSSAQALPYQSIRTAALTPTGRNSPFLSTVDRQENISGFASNASLPTTGVYHGERLWLFLDGTVEINSQTNIWVR